MDIRDPHKFGLDDLARIKAIEHLVTTLWSVFTFNQADAMGLPATEVAKNFRESIEGTVVDSGMPAELRDLMRAHIRDRMDEVMMNAETFDGLSAKG